MNNLPKCIRGHWSIEIPECEQETIKPLLPAQPTGGECSAPEIFNGRYEVLGNPNIIPGDPIPNFALVNFTCNSERYLLTTPYSNIVSCIDGVLRGELPKCVPSCPARNSTSIDIRCELNGIEINCEKRVPDGTIATMKCKQHYVGENSTSICIGGSWDELLIKCIPECGQVTPNAQLYIVGGSTVKKGEFPWHVAIYRQKPKEPIEYTCAGSIISVNIVLSAAQCFTKPEDGKLYPISEYYVAAGKYYHNWDAPEDEYFVQKRNVSKIELPDSIYFSQISYYAGDIAVVVVDTPFTLTNVVKPVCVDWNSELFKNQLKNRTLGEVAGWGYTSDKEDIHSPVLRQLSVPYIERVECLNIIPYFFRLYITLDKYCAGYTNGSSVCYGDSGGGMVFPHVNLNEKKYYIQGILSVAPVEDGHCDTYQLAGYTKVYHHIEFIKTIEENNRIE